MKIMLLLAVTGFFAILGAVIMADDGESNTCAAPCDAPLPEDAMLEWKASRTL